MSISAVELPGPAIPAFSQGVRAGPWLVVSGQVPTLDGKLVGPDPLAQARQCFANIEAVLAAAGYGFADVVKLTCFLTDEAAYAGYAQAKREAVGLAAPCGTGVIVSGLLVPGALMEVEAIAYREA
jgi:2-iminobutanoate/2-iminopropanoate deaminase